MRAASPWRAAISITLHAMSQSWWTGSTLATLIRMCARFPAAGEKISRSGCWAPACIAHSWHPAWPSIPFRLCFAFRAGYAAFRAPHLYRTQFKTFSAAGKPYAMVCNKYYRRREQTATPNSCLPMQQACEATPWGNRPTAAADWRIWRPLSGSPSEQYGGAAGASMSLVGDKAESPPRLESSCGKPVRMKLWSTGRFFDHHGAARYSFDLAMDVKQELLG